MLQKIFWITLVSTGCFADSTHSGSVSIPRRPTLTSDEDSALAKSLPMRVPMSNYRTQDIDIDDRVCASLFNFLNRQFNFSLLPDTGESRGNGSLN